MFMCLYKQLTTINITIIIKIENERWATTVEHFCYCWICVFPLLLLGIGTRNDCNYKCINITFINKVFVRSSLAIDEWKEIIHDSNNITYVQLIYFFYCVLFMRETHPRHNMSKWIRYKRIALHHHEQNKKIKCFITSLRVQKYQWVSQ